MFGETDYMSEICANLFEIIDALDQFQKFLGPELKAVTGDSAGIDQVLMKVQNLTEPLKNLPFEDKIFDKSYEKPWEAIMKKFRSSVSDIEKLTEVFIKESFRKLRSAEGAFELVQNFQKIGVTPPPPPSSGGGATAGGASNAGTGSTTMPSAGSSIKQQISERYKDILEQYLRELAIFSDIFHSKKDCPPIYKNFPPVAGAIAWARDLYLRAKRPILRFKKHGNLLDDEFGESVKEKYLAFARITDSYINDLYNDWEHLVSNAAVEKLRNPVLKSIAKYDTTKTDKEKEKGAGAASISFMLPPPPYRVSFPEELKMIIRESRYLDKMGFRIPENALNITLQDNKYYTISRTLNEKLFEYDRCMETLTKTEKIVMKAHIDELNSTIKVGFYPLNWTSQRIPAYIEELDMALVKFKSTISQLHKNASMIEEIVNGIASTLLIQPKDFKSSQTGVYEPMDISEFYEIIDSRRVARLDALVAEYKTIGDSFLLKVEEVVAKTATGFSPVLAAYYNYW